MVALRTGFAERARGARPDARIDLQTGRHAGRIGRPGGLASRAQVNLSPRHRSRKPAMGTVLAFRWIKPGPVSLGVANRGCLAEKIAVSAGDPAEYSHADRPLQMFPLK